MTLSSFAQLAARFVTAEADMHLAQEAILERACQLIEDEAKAAIGTYKYEWSQLAQSTQEQRVALGYSANDPLLRTGELRDSIGHVVEGDTVTSAPMIVSPRFMNLEHPGSRRGRSLVAP